MRMPVSHGEPIPTCAPDYETIFASPRWNDADSPQTWALVRAATQSPAEPLADDIRQAVEALRPDIEGLREVLRCTQVVDAGTGIVAHDLATALRTQTYLILDGHLRFHEHDVAGAIERYADTIRFGEDLDAAGSLTGPDAVGNGSLAWARILATRARDSAPSLTAVADALQRLEPFVPTLERYWRNRKLLFVEVAMEPPDGEIPPLDAPMFDSMTSGQKWGARLTKLLLPTGALTAASVWDLDADYDAIIDVARADDRAAEARLADSLAAQSARTWNPLLFVAIPGATFPALAGSIRRMRVGLSLARGVIEVERGVGADGRYPRPEAIELPMDPSADAARLHYAVSADSRSYELWAVGSNGRDDGGRSTPGGSTTNDDPDDVVVERVSAEDAQSGSP